MTTQDPHTLIGAYALDALDANERRAFVDHLTICGDCASEVAGLTATTARLGSAATAQPPAGLRASVMAEVNRTRQLPRSEAAEQSDVATVTPLNRVRTRLHTMAAVAAALFIVAGTLGGIAVVERHRVSTLEQTSSSVAAVYAADDAQTHVAAAGPGRITVVSSTRLGRAVAIVHGVPATSGRDMQLWVIKDGHYSSAGLMHADSPVLADGITTTAQIGVTSEPKGGSKQPTSEPLATVSLT